MKRFKHIIAALCVLVIALTAVTCVYGTTSLATSIKLAFKTDFVTTNDFSSITNPMLLDRSITLTTGEGANQANMIFADSRSLADGAGEVLDLYASGSLLDPLGGALTIETVKIIYLKNTSTDASLLVGGGDTPIGVFADASDILTLPPGGIFLVTAPNATGWDITTNKNLKLEHNGDGSSALVYEIIVIGVD